MNIDFGEDKSLIEYFEKSSNCVLYFQNNIAVWNNASAEKINDDLIDILSGVDKSRDTVDVVSYKNTVVTYHCQPAENGVFLELIDTEGVGSNISFDYMASNIMNDIIKTANRGIVFKLKETYYALEEAEAYSKLNGINQVYNNTFKILRTISMYKEFVSLIDRPLHLKNVIIMDEFRRYCTNFAPCFYVSQLDEKFAVSNFEEQRKRTDNLFEYEISDSEYIVQTDIVKLKAAVSNLLSNAFYFTSPGNKVKIKVYVSNGVLKISVIDKGVGFLPNEIDKVKTPFYSYDPNTKKRAGMGLGLSYADIFAKKSGGECIITSSKGQTMVTLSIPLTQEADDREIKYQPILNQSIEKYDNDSIKNNLLAISNVLKLDINRFFI